MATYVARSRGATSSNELTSDAPSAALPSSTAKHIPARKERNAFTALMSPSPSSHSPPKRKRTPPPTVPHTDPSRATASLGRNGLGAYISSPETFPASRVIYHTPKHVLINDLYPKSSIHLLLLPRSSTKMFLHPFEAFEDAQFLAETKAEVAKARVLVAEELKRRFGKGSALEQRWGQQQQQQVKVRKEGEVGSVSGKETEGKGKGEPHDAPGTLTTHRCHDEDDKSSSIFKRNHRTSEPTPPTRTGRDWEREIIAGVHAVPSMNHLHIHILSRDRYSECLKHRKHYNSFATGFMVPLEDFPLHSEDRRRWPGRAGFLSEGLKCWRCGKEFGNSFVGLKAHLKEEFEAWKNV